MFDQASMATRSSERLQNEADLRKGLERTLRGDTATLMRVGGVN